MNPSIMLAAVIAMAREEEEILNDVIEGLIKYKADKATWKMTDGKEDDKPVKPFTQVAIMMIKWETEGMSKDEAMKMVMNRSKIASTATEFHDMLKDVKDN